MEEVPMQKAHLYEAIFLVNRGVDEACFDEELVLFEDHRARLNSYFCSTIQRSEQRDSVRFETRHRVYEKNTLDEVQVYRDVQVLEARRSSEGKPPKVWFFAPEEQREWERQYPKPPDDGPRAEGQANS
jgi:hypothetical protein